MIIAAMPPERPRAAFTPSERQRLLPPMPSADERDADAPSAAAERHIYAERRAADEPMPSAAIYAERRAADDADIAEMPPPFTPPPRRCAADLRHFIYCRFIDSHFERH